MSIVSMAEILNQALSGKYAVGYYESWDQYSMEAAIEAAEECHSPAILGFGGAVTNQVWLDRNGVEEMASLAHCLAEASRVPTAILFNEARSLKQLRRGMSSGCNTVMLDTSHLPYEDNLSLTKQVVELAHPMGIMVEAELGHLADGSDPTVQAVGTDPDQAARFCERSGIDALAVSIGNMHILFNGEATIDIGLLDRIHQSVAVPLVVHGGTGFPASVVSTAIKQGVAKFNVGTRLKQTYLGGIRDAIGALPQEASVHALIGSRDESDILMHAKSLLKEEIKRFIQLYGSVGKANQPG
jgi:ketose-bisphosphate aldolase